jgi:2-polyprenyl-3-methyl-5-hydroxy-6-metoxy-1,4-benzoquinol methylase
MVGKLNLSLHRYFKRVDNQKLRLAGLKFYRTNFTSTSSTCPACSTPNSRILLSIKENSTELIVLSCKNCATIYYPNAKAPDYEIVENEASFYMRIDQFEGIDSALMPLFSVPELNSYSVIDIGCGLGFTSDFVRFQGRECQAFDPSSAAKISSQILKIEISQIYADSSNTETKNVHKLVFASEVIEHVENPLNFLEQLKAISGESGYLIVTTPNADYVKKGNPTNTILAMLAPSQHLFLLSANVLEDLARDAGFSWAKCWTQDERLFLAAGPKSQQISNHFSRTEYIEYLKSRLSREDIDESIRYRSFGYRLFKEYVHGGKYVEAQELWIRLVRVFQSMHLDLQSPIKIVKGYEDAAGVEMILPTPKEYPYNMALIMFLKGTLLVAFEHDRISAKPYFDAAITISELYRKVFTNGNFQAYDLELQNVGKWAQDQISLHSL